jgi:hypothetical protein
MNGSRGDSERGPASTKGDLVSWLLAKSGSLGGVCFRRRSFRCFYGTGKANQYPFDITWTATSRTLPPVGMLGTA